MGGNVGEIVVGTKCVTHRPLTESTQSVWMETLCLLLLEVLVLLWQTLVMVYAVDALLFGPEVPPLLRLPPWKTP